MRIRVILLVLISICLNLHAQIPYIDSKQYLEEGLELYKNEQYKKAIEKYRQIHECDTNYSTALYEEVLSQTADSAFATAKILALSGLRLPQADKRDFLLSLAAIYDYMDQADSALLFYDSLKRLCPHDHQAWYEAGVVYFKKKLYDKAARNFQQSLIISPQHYGSHYLLGMCYAMQGRLSEAMIAMQASLLMTQNTAYARKSITIISSITSETDEIVKLYHEKPEQYSHPLFDEIDQLVNSKLALNSNYKLQIDINDEIFRQTQVIMEKLKYDPNDSNFVMQYYVPLFTEVFKNDMFEPFMLLLYSGYGFDNVDALAKKNTKHVNETRDVVFSYLRRIQATRELNYTKRLKATERYHYYPSDNIIVVGTSVNRNDKNLFIGDIQIFRGNHTLRSQGHYNNNGEQDGIWTDYYATGVVRSKDKYAKGIKKDTSLSYYSNGNLRMMTLLNKEGNVNAEYEYTYYGWLTAVRKQLPGDRIEVKEYYQNGQLEVAQAYEGKQVADGKYSVYYATGKIKKEFSYKDGNYDGPIRVFYENGQISEEASYVNGKPDGPYIAYFEDGKVKEKSAYKNGKEEGPYEKYYDNGILSEKGIHSKGLTTEVNFYSKTGHLYGTINLNDNIPYKIRFTDEDDKVVFLKENKKGIYDYELYHSNGVKASDMKINEDGQRNGTISFYDNNGAKYEETVYKDGNIEGKSTTYYNDGKIKTTQNYTNDNRDGYYKGYFHNGNVMQEGWYKDGKAQGLWRTYAVNGKLENEKYFLNNRIEGYVKEYNINGQLTNKYMYDYGSPIAHTCYDSAEHVTDSFNYTTRYNTYRCHYSTNKSAVAELEYNVQYGNTEGLCLYRYPDNTKQDEKYFKEGYKDSITFSYYPDGKLRYKGAYLKGGRTGKWEFYNETGDLVKEDNYNKEGEREGKAKSYAGNALHVAYNFKGDSKDGEQIYYGENNRPAFILYYDDGCFVGYTHEGKDGKMLPMIKVKNGTATFTTYYSNGQKSGEADIQKSVFRGKLITYYSNGNIAEERNYKFFDLDGAFKRYTPEGKLIYACNYTDDEETGPEITYDTNGIPVISASYYYGVLHGPTIITDPATHNTRTYNYRYGQLISAIK